MLFYAPSYLYFGPGIILSLFGAFLILSVFLKINIGFIPGLHSMMTGNFSIIIGYQLLFLSILAYLSGRNAGFLLNYNPLMSIVEKLKLEHAVIIGLFFMVSGLSYLILIFRAWIIIGYSVFPINGSHIIAYSLITIGFQTIFNSFLISMIQNK
jgi:hypothetical protein